MNSVLFSAHVTHYLKAYFCANDPIFMFITQKMLLWINSNGGNICNFHSYIEVLNKTETPRSAPVQ